MAQLFITPQRVAPYVISGAAGVHILARMRHLSRRPASDAPLHFFLLKHTDVVLSLSGASIAIWHLAKHKPRQQTTSTTPHSATMSLAEKSVLAKVVYELRQTFTALLLGLGLIKRKASIGDTGAISGLVKRLDGVVRRGMQEVDTLEASGWSNAQEREYGA